MRNNRCIYIISFLLLAVILPACATVPITGRKQLNMISDQALLAQVNSAFAAYYNDCAKKNIILSRHESKEAQDTIDFINKVTKRILAVSSIGNKYQWETLVIKDSTPNAAVLPNGKIFVNTGILGLTENEAGLATVVGHEVGHVTASHAAERMSQILLVELGLAVADATIRNQNNKKMSNQTRNDIMAALGLGVTYGLVLPYSRERELEADYIGLLYMAKAGFDPTEAVNFWDRMGARHSSSVDFFSTHPSSEKRITKLKDNLIIAKLYYGYNALPLPANLKQTDRAMETYLQHISTVPLALCPSLSPGFWYKTRTSNGATIKTCRYDHLEPCDYGQCSVHIEESGKKIVKTADFSALVAIHDTNGVWFCFKPPLRILRWPLKVSNSWSETITVESNAGDKHNSTFNTSVLTYESVKTPAGTFMTYKIIVSQSGSKFLEVWYAPEAKTFVRTINYDDDGRRSNIEELVDYQRDSNKW